MAIVTVLQDVQDTGKIDAKSMKRLKLVHALLYTSWQQGLVTFEKDGRVGKDCILGWSKLLVKDPKALNTKVREMVELNEDKVLNKDEIFSKSDIWYV